MESIWSAHPFLLDIGDSRYSFWAWVLFLKERCDSDTFLLAVVVMWKQWEIRNSEVHGSKFYPSADVVSWSQEFLERFWGAQVHLPPRSNPQVGSVWSPPPPGYIKINTDASFPGNSKDAWVSMVARNSDGECVWWSKKLIVGQPGPADGEALAILHGLKIAQPHGGRNVMMESDCLQVVNCLTRASRSLASFGAILDSCFDLFPLFQNVSFFFIRRLGNMLAHRLAASNVIPSSEGATLTPEFGFDDE